MFFFLPFSENNGSFHACKMVVIVSFPLSCTFLNGYLKLLLLDRKCIEIFYPTPK